MCFLGGDCGDFVLGVRFGGEGGGEGEVGRWIERLFIWVASRG